MHKIPDEAASVGACGPDEMAALDIARDLARLGVPVFVAALDDRGNPLPPPGWQRTEPDPIAVDCWRPGMALCAVMGHKFDALDMDPRHGGADSLGALLSELGGGKPTVYGTVETPSGGRHYWLAPLGVGSRDGFRPGLDLKGGRPDGEGRGFVFLPPTERPSKVTGEPCPYRWSKIPVHPPAAADRTGTPLARVVHGALNGSGTVLAVRPGIDLAAAAGSGIPAGEAHDNYLARLVMKLCGQGFEKEQAYAVWLTTVNATETNPAKPFTRRDFERHWKGAATKVQPVPAPETAQAGPKVVSMADVQPERVEWIWHGFLPLGKLVTLDGDPGVGKSTLMVDCAARVSTGSPMPDGSRGIRGGVLILSAEDGLADTVRPRLDAARADLSRVVAITEIECEGPDGPWSRPVSIPHDLAAIEQVIQDNDVRLVIVDVLMAYLSGEVNSYRDQDIRRVMHALKELAERHRCCIVILRHLNKSSGASAVYRGGGSIGIVGAARVGLMAAADPDDETGSLFVLARVKGNLSEPPPAQAYRLVPDALHGCACVSWDGASAHTPASLLAEGSEEARGEATEAAQWLRAYLESAPAWTAGADEITKAGQRAGFSPKQLRTARRRLGVTTARVGFGAGGAWSWSLDPSGAITESSGEHAPSPIGAPIDAYDAHSQGRASKAPMGIYGETDATESDSSEPGVCSHRYRGGSPKCILCGTEAVLVGAR
jgi:hypothetical protein